MDILDGLNTKQQEAVIHNKGPLLLLAGAGSGKTRVLTHRIAYLINEYDVNPYYIMALTFTNKAAAEMRERVNNIVGYGAESIWVSTFHSTCVRILRRNIDRLGYDRNFTIYDADDQKTLMRDICKYLNIDTKKYKERTFINAISSAKDELKDPERYALENETDFEKKYHVRVYREYQKRLQKNNALDFDDLIMKTVQLFKEHEDVLAYYQNRFLYLLVDEYQDTNTAQFILLSLLSKANRNLCVVGDDDQSIYKFRGANIYNILNFEKIFPDATVIRLEQNYRSTNNILQAANGVIQHNTTRKEKSLWTQAEDGASITYTQYANEYEEANGIVQDIHGKANREGLSYNDFAILYRTNAQSRVFEEKFIREGIPYRIVGAINFYARKEIKDLLAYLKIVNNSSDDISTKRIVNVPKRGIGLTTIDRITAYSLEQGISFYEALRNIEYIPGCERASSKITSFVSLIEEFKTKTLASDYLPSKLLDEIAQSTGYIRNLEIAETIEATSRIENIEELRNKIIHYEENEVDEVTLSGLLEDIALVADIDTVDHETAQVLLMTIHSAKGLEFPHVYLCGMEENVFPGAMAVTFNDEMELEEERRLCYVGITRAMKKLTLTSAKQRMKNGDPHFNSPSRFINEIPRFLMTHEATKPLKRQEATNYKPSKASIFHSGKKNPFEDNPYIQKGMTSFTPDYTVGDTVSHLKFGTGKIISLTKLDNDYEVVIEFEVFGQRKLRTSFAKLKKL